MAVTFTFPDGRVLPAGTPFSLSVPIGDGEDVVQFPSNWLMLASGDDLARYGIVRATVADPSPPLPTESDYKIAIQALIDQVAVARQYTNGETVAKYALLPSSPPGTLWKEEAQYFIQWTANVWSYVFVQLAAVQNGERPQPSVDYLISEILTHNPVNWPTA